MAKRKITYQSGKAKGRRLQQWTANLISRVTGIPWGKDELIASREMGQSGVDVRLIGDAKQMFPFSVECKAQEKWSVPAWIKQAQENEMDDTAWLLIFKRNNEKPVMAMDAEKFFMLWGQVLRMASELEAHEKGLQELKKQAERISK